MTAQCAVLLFAFCAPLAGVDPAPVANMSGTWILDLQQSVWDGVNKPIRQSLVIEHHEPRFRYSGSVLYVNEETREFSFDGALDNRPYSMVRSYGEGKITSRRRDAYTFESVFRSSDGLYEEQSQTWVSRDGKTLTRSIYFRAPDTSKRWVEVYRRQ